MRDIERLGHLHNDLDNGFQLGSSIIHDSSGDPADLTANGANHIVRRQRSPDPLQLELADWLDLYGVLDFHQYPRTDENLSWLGFVAEPRGDVGNGADGGVVEAPLITNRAKRGEAVAIRSRSQCRARGGSRLPSKLRGRYAIQVPSRRLGALGSPLAPDR